MAHTLLDAIKYVRTSILDDTGGTGIDWSTITEYDPENHQLRWSNEELTTFINEAWKQVARRTLCYKDTDSYTLTVKTGNPYSTMSDKIITIKSVESQAQESLLLEKDILQLDDIKGWRTENGYLKYWIPEYHQRVVRWFPIPMQDDTCYLTVYRLPLIDLTWDNPDQKIDIRDEWFLGMLNYAAAQAYLKDEANSLDERRSQMFMNMFTAEFSDTSAYSEMRKKKTTNRGIKYGGITGYQWFPRSRDTWR